MELNTSSSLLNNELPKDVNIELCKFCNQEAKYKCPQCNVSYCSLLCYKCKNHLNCSEKFYKNLVENELKNTRTDEYSRRSMLNILSKVNETNFDEEVEEDMNNISIRLKGVDLDDADTVWSKLSEHEQNGFLELVKSGDIDSIITPWQPWWDVQLVEEIETTDDKNIPSYMQRSPPIVECPLLSSLTKISPSPSIPFNIINVLGAYVWVVILFNGDHYENSLDAAEAILCLSPVLSKGSNFNSADIAVTTPRLESQHYPWLKNNEDYYKKVQDGVRKILSGPCKENRSYYVSAALSDIYSLFKICKKNKSRNSNDAKGVFACVVGAHNEGIEKRLVYESKLLNKCVQKIEFLLSYVKEYPDNICKI